MLAYIFSVLFIATLITMIGFYQKRSKPSQLYVSPKDAKSYMFDKYWEIEQMPTGMEKDEARRQWRIECDALQQKLKPEIKELNVKIVD